MKRTLYQRILSIFGLSVLLILFFACQDAPQVSEQQKVKVTFTVEDNMTRTVLPQASLTNVASYKLLGGKNGTTETVLIESFTGTGTSVLLDSGIWNFTLNAYNDSGENILQGKVQNKQINLTGTNQVNFSLSGIKSGFGSIQITLNFPEVAGITQIRTTGDVGLENFIPDTGGSFIYTINEIAAGDYFISFELYRGYVLRTVVSELVLVRSGLISSKIITLVGEDLKPISLTGTITINPAVSAIIGTELSAVYNGTETVTYQWSKDGSAISNATGVKYTPNSTGSYTVTVNAASNNTSLTSTAVAVIGSVATVPGTTLNAKLVWLANTVESNVNYVLDVSEDETIPSFTLSYSGKSNIVITLKSTGLPRTISSSNQMFTIESGVILVLDNKITLQRQKSNEDLFSVNGMFVMNAGSTITRGIVNVARNGIFNMNDGTISDRVSNGGNFTMNDGTISGGVSNGGNFTMNDGTISGGVYVPHTGNFTMKNGKISNSNGKGVEVKGGTFNMNGGEISNSTGDGVYVHDFSYIGIVGKYEYIYGIFTMSGGTISGNSGSGVYVYNGSFFTMNGGTISGNTASNGGGVCGPLIMNGGTISGNTATNGGGVCELGGSFTMNGGTISGNTATYGGGVYELGGSFTMNGGTISGNTATYGGGVYDIYWKSAFTMSNGNISGNTATYGGGVYVDADVMIINGENTFIMSNGNISGNNANSSGGGVYVNKGNFTISNGNISGNTANSSGGGVYVLSSSSFGKTGGTIYGYTSGDSNSNTVKNSSNTIINNKGHAVWIDYSVITIHKETTAGPDVTLSWNGTVNPPTFNGGWEY